MGFICFSLKFDFARVVFGGLDPLGPLNPILIRFSTACFATTFDAEVNQGFLMDVIHAYFRILLG